MGGSTQAVGALQLIKWYGGRGIILFILLAVLVGIWQLWEPPVYSARSTARVGARQSVATISPLAMLAGDNIEDELAVLESLAIREYTANELHLECLPVPAWQPNPFGYQVARVFAFVFRTAKPLDYGKLDYPQTTELELDYGKMARRQLLIEVDTAGNYILLVNGHEADRQPVGTALAADGLRIALTGFTPGVAQRWRLKLTEPELVAIALHDKLTILRVGARSNTIGVKCEALHPGLAARIVNTMMGYYIRRDTEKKQQNSSEMLVYIDQQIGSVEQELAGYRSQIEELLSDQKALIASGNAPSVANSYLSYQNQLSELYTEQAQFKQLQDLLSSDDPMLGYYSSDILRRPVEISLAQGILDNEQLLADELVTKTEDHPDVVQLKQTIARQRGDLASLVDESLSQVERKIGNARTGVGRFEELLARSPEASTELDQLESEVTVATQVLGTLYAERQRVALEKESDVSPIVILDEGQANYRPARPRLVMAAFVSILVALLLTAAFLIVLRLLDTDVRDAASLAGRYGAPVLASLDAEAQPANELEARRLRLLLGQLLGKTTGKLGLIGTTGMQQADLVYATCRKVLGDSETASDKADVDRLVAARGVGEAALYDESLAAADGVILLTTPGRKRLRQLAPVVAVLQELGYTLRGWILLSR